MPKFLDDNGLLYFWQKIKSKFLTNVAYDSTNKKLTKTINGSTSDIVSVSTIKTALNLSKSDVGLGNVDNTSDANKPISTATQTALNGKVDVVSGKGLSTNDFTTTLKNKLDGIASGAEVNQNAFSNVKVGSTTVAADAKTDTLELVAGSNITLTPDATNDKVTIAASNTTYSDVVAGGSSGLMSGSDKTKLDGIASGAEVNQNAFSNVKVGSTTVAADTKTDTLELAAGSNITLTPDATNDKVTIAATVPAKSTTTPSANGTASAGSETAYAAGDHVHPLQTTISGNAGTATTLYNARCIDGVYFNGSANIVHFGVSSTEGRHKNVTCTGFKYEHGARITVLFTGNPNATGETGSCTLSVNNLAEVPIHYYFGTPLGSPQVATEYKLLQKNYTYEFVYYSQDSTTCFLVLSSRDTNTTYMPASSESSGLMSSSDKTKLDGIAEGANNYVHPAYTAATAAAVKVGRDATGHVVLGNALAKGDVGLGNVDNTSDADKPVSTATQTALNGKANSSHAHGEISSDGAITTSTRTVIGNGDWLIFSDSSDGGKIKKAYAVFDGSTTDQALTKKGTFETFITSSALTTRLSSYVPNNRTINGHALSSSVNLTASDVGACPLNASSKIDAQYLPSYVDDIIEAYARSGQTALSSTWLATGSASGTVITPETGKIYVLMADSGDYSANSQFRWSGTAYVKLNDGGVSAITNSEIDTIVAS